MPSAQKPLLSLGTSAAIMT
jgi:hypothetical protein